MMGSVGEPLHARMHLGDVEREKSAAKALVRAEGASTVMMNDISVNSVG